MRRRILFIDHAFHEKTRSSAFFTDILAKDFDLDIVLLQPGRLFNRDLLARGETADHIVLWQMDYLAPVFLALGRPVVSIPMYDGSASLPALHWLASYQASMLNFSYTLHARLQQIGLNCKLVRHYKPAVATEALPTFDDGLRVFLWQRRPDTGIHAKAVEHLLGNQIRFLHIHNAPDSPEINGDAYLPQGSTPYELKVTSWFDDPAEYQSALSQCNTFICPRHSEGIGMAMLEAIARGMLVLAPDAPTHTEYVANWINGILFNPAHPSPANVGNRASALACNAWIGAQIGHQTWLEQVATLPAFIMASKGSGTPALSTGDLLNFARNLSSAFYAGHAAYEAFLKKNLRLISQISGLKPQDIDRKVMQY